MPRTDENRPIIKFVIHTDWDARGHLAFFYAPDDWADMDDDAREKFMREEAETWMAERVELAWHAYANTAETKADDHGWGKHFDTPDEMW